MQVHKETIWHFTCVSCTSYWSIATMDAWHPKELYCPHCGTLNKNDTCSCGHKIVECDCKAGCSCGCNKRYLEAH